MNGTISSYCAERGRNTFQTTNGLARMAEAEFEAQLQEFCRFARLGFTILNQSPSQLVGVGNALRSLGDGAAADDLLGLVNSGGEKAEALLELTNAARLRCEAAFLAANNPALST